jgi:hypothetical protein
MAAERIGSKCVTSSQITEGTLVRREAVVSIRPIGSNRVEVSLTNGMAFNISIGEDEVSRSTLRQTGLHVRIDCGMGLVLSAHIQLH